MGIGSLNICSLEDVSENLLQTDFANCCRTVGGRFEFLIMFTGLSFGLHMVYKYYLLNQMLYQENLRHGCLFQLLSTS